MTGYATCLKCLAAAVLLTGCAGDGDVIYRPVCLDVVEYSQAQRDQWADEIEAAPADAFWPDAAIDNLNLRAQARAACDGGR